MDLYNLTVRYKELPYLQLGNNLEDYYRVPLRLLESMSALLDNDRDKILAAKSGQETMRGDLDDLPEELLDGT